MGMNKRKRVTVECVNCGQKLERIPYHADRDNVCSDECYDEYFSEKFTGEGNPNYSERVQVNCQRCEKRFEIIPSQATRRKYCSRECMRLDIVPDRHRDEDGEVPDKYKECLICGEYFRVSPAEYQNRKTCGKSCFARLISRKNEGRNSPLWKEGGGIGKDYGEDWYSKRRLVLEADDARCVFCGKDESDIGREPDVHHILPVRFFDPPSLGNYIGNLVTLCHSCHGYFEGKFISPRLMANILEMRK